MTTEIDEKKKQEIVFRFQMFEQQMQNLQQQLQAVEQGVVELNSLNLGLDELVGGKDKEIMAPIGRGIFAKAKLLSEDLVVDIGNKNLVKKSIPDTKKILEEQIEKLGEVRKELVSEAEKIQGEMAKIFEEVQREA